MGRRLRFVERSPRRLWLLAPVIYPVIANKRTLMKTKEPLPYLTVLSPCFRDENNIEELCRRITCVCEGLGRSYEILLVDDGSPDGTWEMIKRVAARDLHVVGIRLSRNFGHQLAVTAGLANAKATDAVRPRDLRSSSAPRVTDSRL